jgi:hypothetical protein
VNSSQTVTSSHQWIEGRSLFSTGLELNALADADWVVRDVYEMHALLMPSGV